MRRFERRDQEQTLFWEAWCDGALLISRFGDLNDKTPRRVVRELDTRADAVGALARAVQQKMKAGFVEVDATTRGGRSLRRNPLLEDAIHDRPDDVDAWRVYVDWLLENDGGARAKLASLELEAARTPQRQGALSAEIQSGREQLFSWKHADPDFEVKFGFLKRLSGPSLPEDPDAVRFLQTLRIRGGGDIDYPRLFQALREAAPASLRTLTMDVETPEETELSWIDVGEFGLFPFCPRLETVHLKGGGIALGPVLAPRLRSLTLVSTGLGVEPVERLAEAEAPELTSLQLWIGTSDRVTGAFAEIGAVSALLKRKFPKLRRLGLLNCEYGNALVDAVLDSPLIGQLRHLDLSLGTIGAAGADHLLSRAEALAHLTLDLSDNLIDEGRCLALSRAGIDPGPQREGGEEDAYVAVGE